MNSVLRSSCCCSTASVFPSITRLSSSIQPLQQFTRNIYRGNKELRVVLTEDVEDIGQKGELVSINRGRARNFLIHQHRAVYPTPSTLALYNITLPPKRSKKRFTDAELEARSAYEKMLAETLIERQNRYHAERVMKRLRQLKLNFLIPLNEGQSKDSELLPEQQIIRPMKIFKHLTKKLIFDVKAIRFRSDTFKTLTPPTTTTQTQSNAKQRKQQAEPETPKPQVPVFQATEAEPQPEIIETSSLQSVPEVPVSSQPQSSFMPSVLDSDKITTYGTHSVYVRLQCMNEDDDPIAIQIVVKKPKEKLKIVEIDPFYSG